MPQRIAAGVEGGFQVGAAYPGLKDGGLAGFVQRQQVVHPLQGHRQHGGLAAGRVDVPHYAGSAAVRDQPGTGLAGIGQQGQQGFIIWLGGHSQPEWIGMALDAPPGEGAQHLIGALDDPVGGGIQVEQAVDGAHQAGLKQGPIQRQMPGQLRRVKPLQPLALLGPMLAAARADGCARRQVHLGRLVRDEPGGAAGALLKAQCLVNVNGGGVIVAHLQPGRRCVAAADIIQGGGGEGAPNAAPAVIGMDCHVGDQVAALAPANDRDQAQVAYQLAVFFPHQARGRRGRILSQRVDPPRPLGAAG